MHNDLETNKTIATRWLDLISQHEVEAICEMTAEDWQMHGGPPQLPSGPAGVRKLFEHIGSVQQKWQLEDIIAEGDRVLVRATNTCTQDDFFGVPGAGQTQIFSAMFLHRIKGGKICETWRNADDLGRLLQLGARIVAPVRG